MAYNHPIGKDYKWYILPIGWLYITYHLLREPKKQLLMMVANHLCSPLLGSPLSQIPMIMNLANVSNDHVDRNSAIFQESYNTPRYRTPVRQFSYPTMKGFPENSPLVQGLGVCSKGVLKQPQKFVTLIKFMNSHSHHHTCQPLVSKSYLNLCKCVKNRVAFKQWQKQMFYPPWT